MDKSVVVKTTRTTKITLSEDEVKEIILEHLRLKGAEVEFYCRQGYLEEVYITSVETTVEGS